MNQENIIEKRLKHRSIDVFDPPVEAEPVYNGTSTTTELAIPPSSTTETGSPPALVKQKSKNDVPSVLNKLQKWADYDSFGETLDPTKFIPMKTPMSAEIMSNWSLEQPPTHALTIASLLQAQHQHGREVGMIIDLANHECLYAEDIPSTLEYAHINLIAKVIPPVEAVVEVERVASEFWRRKPNSYIAIHCAYGFNRTGFILCSYLCQVLGMSVDEALEAFATARPPGVRHINFKSELIARYGGDDGGDGDNEKEASTLTVSNTTQLTGELTKANTIITNDLNQRGGTSSGHKSCHDGSAHSNNSARQLLLDLGNQTTTVASYQDNDNIEDSDNDSSYNYYYYNDDDDDNDDDDSSSRAATDIAAVADSLETSNSARKVGLLPGGGGGSGNGGSSYSTINDGGAIATTTTTTTYYNSRQMSRKTSMNLAKALYEDFSHHDHHHGDLNTVGDRPHSSGSGRRNGSGNVSKQNSIKREQGITKEGEVVDDNGGGDVAKNESSSELKSTQQPPLPPLPVPVLATAEIESMSVPSTVSEETTTPPLSVRSRSDADTASQSTSSPTPHTTITAANNNTKDGTGMGRTLSTVSENQSLGFGMKEALAHFKQCNMDMARDNSRPDLNTLDVDEHLNDILSRNENKEGNGKDKGGCPVM
jgi:hypothetical protein